MLVGKKNKDNELSIRTLVKVGRPESKIIITPLHNIKVTFEAIPH
jgi:hypothetical protein